MIPNPLRDPWAITEAGLEVVIGIASRGEHFTAAVEKALEARAGQPLRNARTVEMRDGVAMIPVAGPLMRHASMLTEISGATSYGALRKDLQVAVDDPAVTAILLNIDSPGGEVNGCAELADAIFAARSSKPIVAYVGGTGASAAYWLASAAGEVVCSDTAILGSIGVRTALVDDAKKQDAAGERKIEIVSSQSPYKRTDPASEDDRARVQATIDQLAEVFVGAVARNRGATAATVLSSYGQGGVMVGRHAVEAGLADRIGSFESTLASMAQRHKGASMNLTMIASALGLPEGADEQQIAGRAVALSKFEIDARAATSSTTSDEAIGKIAAGVEALRDLATVRAEMAATAASARKRDLRASLEQAMAGDHPRLTLGQLGRVIPAFLGDQRAAAQAAIAAAKDQTASALLDALCSVDVSPAALDGARAFIDALGPALPTSAAQPKTDAIGDLPIDEDAIGIGAMAANARKILDGNRAQ